MNIKYIFIAADVLEHIPVLPSQRLMNMLLPGKRVALGGVSKFAVVSRRSVSTLNVLTSRDLKVKLDQASDDLAKARERHQQLAKQYTTALQQELASEDNPSFKKNDQYAAVAALMKYSPAYMDIPVAPIVATRVNDHTAYMDVPGKGRSYFPAPTGTTHDNKK